MSSMPNPFGGNRAHPADTLGYESRAGSSAVVAFFNTVYAWMASGLALTAAVAWWVSTRPDIAERVFSGPVLLGLFIAQIILVMTVSAAVERIGATTATALFMLYSALNGLTLSVIFLLYSRGSLASAFIVTAGTFGAMSVYGFVTKRDLTRMGSLLFMALIGLVIASVVNIFMASTTLEWVITYAGVLIFVGLTAYDTQMLRNIALQTADNPALASRLAISGALKLYLDFINLFLFILRIMGSRRS